MSFLNNLAIHQLFWLVPILFALHNLEEALLMPRWSRRSPLPLLRPVTLLAFGVTALGGDEPPGSRGVLLIVGMQAVFGVNALAPHLALAVRYPRYNPGLLTAALIILPFSIYFLRRVSLEGWVSPGSLWIVLALSPVIMLAVVRIALWIGGVLEELLGGRCGETSDH